MKKKILVPKVIIPVAILSVLTIGVGIFAIQKDTVEMKTSSNVNTSPTVADTEKTVEDTTPAPQTAQTASETPTEPTPTPTPEPEQPIHEKAKAYAINQGETEQQANCFTQILSKRTGWNITEADMQSKYSSIKEVYPSMCAAWNVASRSEADAQLRGM